jgi:drug/metabolite transporter (DMT)-like permease
MTDPRSTTTRLVTVYAGLLVLAVIWGNAFVAIRHAVQFMTPVQVAAARFLPVVILLGGWLVIRDRAGFVQLLRQDWRSILYMAFAGVTVYHLALNTGETRVPAGVASLIIALSPAVAAVLSALFLRERLTPVRVSGLIVSFAGLVIVVIFGEGLRFDARDLGYYLLILLAACVWGSYGVVGQSLLRKHPQMRVMSASLALAGVPLVALAPIDFWPRMVELPLSVWGALGFLALPCTVFAYVIWLNGIRHLGAARVQSFNYLIPLFAVISGVILLGERVTWGLALGGAFIVAGVLAINTR